MIGILGRMQKIGLVVKMLTNTKYTITIINQMFGSSSDFFSWYQSQTFISINVQQATNLLAFVAN